MEDLACFNDETLARTIAASQLPIVSAIGHETDFTIADFVADLRAPTPSAAAELVTAAQHRIEERVQSLAQRVHRAGRYHLLHARQRYARLSAESVLTRLRDAVNRRDQRIDELHLRLASAAQRRLRAPTQRLALLTTRLRRQDIAVRIAATQRRLTAATTRLESLSTQTITRLRTRLNCADTQLEALSPLAVLNRGYALIYLQNEAGIATLLRSSADTTPGDIIQARLAQGTLEAKVTKAQTSTANSKDAE
jgi:exodeoxyribonuclease VII large subunit